MIATISTHLKGRSNAAFTSYCLNHNYGQPSGKQNSKDNVITTHNLKSEILRISDNDDLLLVMKITNIKTNTIDSANIKELHTVFIWLCLVMNQYKYTTKEANLGFFIWCNYKVSNGANHFGII